MYEANDERNPLNRVGVRDGTTPTNDVQAGFGLLLETAGVLGAGYAGSVVYNTDWSNEHATTVAAAAILMAGLTYVAGRLLGTVSAQSTLENASKNLEDQIKTEVQEELELGGQ